MKQLEELTAQRIIHKYHKSKMDILEFAEYAGVSVYVTKKLIIENKRVFQNNVYFQLHLVSEKFETESPIGGDFAINKISKMLEKTSSTVEEVAEAIGRSVSWVKRLMIGEHDARPEDWENLAKFFKVSKWYLMGIDDQPGKSA